MTNSTAVKARPLPQPDQPQPESSGAGPGGPNQEAESSEKPASAMAMVGTLLAITLALLALYLACVNGSWCPESVQIVLQHEGFITATVSAIYLVTLLIARVLLIARPYRKSLEARLEAVRQRAKVRPGEQPHVVDALLTAAQGKLQKSDRVLWSWGDQTGAFELISQAESLLIGRLTAAEARLRLDLVLPEIDRYGATSVSAADGRRRLERSLAEVDRALDPVDAVGTLHGNGVDDRHVPAANDIRTVHSNALQLLHRLQLDEFARILKWHRKVLWLTVVGLGLAVLLATFAHSAILLLMGAAGAYLARLTRIIKRADTQPEDTSSYWTNLLLGPVLGALAAYGGILLIELLGSLDLLGDGLTDVRFDLSGDTTLTFAVAFLFGISEGLVNRIAHAAEGAVVSKADPSEVMPGSSVTGGQ